MARYIDLDILVDAIRDEIEVGRHPFDKWGEYEVDAHLDNLTVTEDVAPVVHAHWTNTSYGGCESLYTCSNCSKEIYVDDCDFTTHEIYIGPQYKYCPYCGAKMDEEEHK